MVLYKNNNNYKHCNKLFVNITINYSRQSENEDHQLNMKRLEDALKKATNDSNQLTEELKREQARTGELEKVKRILELQIKDLQVLCGFINFFFNVFNFRINFEPFLWLRVIILFRS